MLTTKRKIFDASKQRIEGTEAAAFNMKSKGNRNRSTYSSAAQQKGLTTGVKKNNWRKKHEDFIQSIRAAKQVKAHLARGGKLSDLPPPPPSENPDYVQCPHCGRRFNEQAAERHIPKCVNMVHNKPRNGPPAKRRWVVIGNRYSPILLLVIKKFYDWNEIIITRVGSAWGWC